MGTRLGNLIASAEQRDALHRCLIDWMDEHVDPQRGAPWENRAWGAMARPTWEQTAAMRPVRDDGVRPPYFDYDSATVTKGAKAQFS